MLQVTGMESSVIKELKVLLAANLDKRFPITSLIICGFLLDPSQLKIDISRLLNLNQITKELVLSDIIKNSRLF